MVLDHKKLPIACTPEEMVNSLTESAPGTVIFTDDDLPLEGRDHHKALFIKAEVKGKLTTCVMVDNGSDINVCPLRILPKLGLTEADLKPSEVIIKAYDDTKRPVAGTFRALVKTGPIEEWVNLHVIDIPITFAILLGRPWFYPLGGVPSTLHQKIKLPHEGKIVTILAETEAVVAALNLDHREIHVNPGFQVCMIYEDELNPKIASMMKGMNFVPGMGLEKNQQGPPEFVEPKVPISKFGIGYQPSRRARRRSNRHKTLWETFVEEGTNYPYAGKPEPLMIADKLVPSFEIFAEEMNEVRGPIAKEAVIEELVLSEELEEVIPAPK